MTTITVPGFVYLKKAEHWEPSLSGVAGGLVARWFWTEMAGVEGVILTAPSVLTFEVSDDFDSRPAQVAVLRKKQADADVEFHAFTVETNRQINELQAIEYVA